MHRETQLAVMRTAVQEVTFDGGSPAALWRLFRLDAGTSIGGTKAEQARIFLVACLTVSHYNESKSMLGLTARGVNSLPQRATLWMIYLVGNSVRIKS